MLTTKRILFYLATKSKTTVNPISEAPSNQNLNHQPFKIGEYSYTPQINSTSHIEIDKLNQEAQKIFKWAKSKKATHYSFIAYPHTSSICEKQQSFLHLQYVVNRQTGKSKELAFEKFSGNILVKGEGDGSSFPSGGLRATHTARGYTIWDPLSQLYIRPKNQILYIPSLLVNHQGHALDDKTLFRQAQKLLKDSTVKLLNKLQINAKSAIILLGLQQQFFGIYQSSYKKREDLRFLGRAITGNVPPRNQQLGQHYYGKLPQKIQSALFEVEKELLQIGIPLKTKHNEVALNQFQICSICNEAGTAIDQNMILMEILKETFERHKLIALLHQKPFKDINGSGKHVNWSLNYVKQDGNIKNLFAAQASDSQKDIKIFHLFILLNLKAILKNHKLYLTAIATPGNQIRLGGHEAPPRIISVFLGANLSNQLDGNKLNKQEFLNHKITYLNYDVKQQNTDRNRTSPYAYTGNRFEFRALGSSQNPSYAMAVICATLANQIKDATERIEKGESIDQIIQQLTKQTKNIRFQGNGYSQQWKTEAKNRGLYVNEKFAEIYTFMQNQQKIFENLGLCSAEQTRSRAKVAENNYKQTVMIQQKTMILIADKHLIPQSYQYINKIKVDFQSKVLKDNFNQFKNLFEEFVQQVTILRKIKLLQQDDLDKYQKLRKTVSKVGDLASSLTSRLPKYLDERFPDLYEFLKL